MVRLLLRPLVVMLCNFVDSVRHDGRIGETFVPVLPLEIDCGEIVIPSLVIIRQIPVHAEVLQRHVVPLIVVRVVRDLVVVDVLAWVEVTGEFGQLLCVDLIRSARL